MPLREINSRTDDCVVEIYADGACKGNPGPGGWGALLIFKNVNKEIYGGELETTNNRMELMAIIKALQCLRRSCVVELFTDSNYVVNGMTRWIHGWVKNDWLNSQKKPVKNTDLWRLLRDEALKHDVSWIWVKGHDGNFGNERADYLANKGVLENFVNKKMES